MTTKHVTKTTKEYTYDEKGFLVKEVITEEYHEEEIVSTEKILENIKKAKGVPYITETKPFTQPWTITYGPTCGSSLDTSVSSTLSNDDIEGHNEEKAVTNGVTNNYTFNVTGKLHDDVIKQVKEVLDKESKIKPPLKKPTI